MQTECICAKIKNMNELKEKAYAKLNISLDVKEAREDGFHDMEMIMQTVSLSDDISIRLSEDGEVKSTCNASYIPNDDRNLAVRAAKLFFSAAGLEKTGAFISIKKKIPVGAGMAGGSADAAAVLRALNRHFGFLFSQEKMLELAGKLGSDVPFCLIGGTALARGRGEILDRISPLPECAFAICKPEFSVSTPELFRALDGIKMRSHPDTAGMLKAFEEGSLDRICRRMYNVFEDVPDRRMRTIAEIKSRILDGGAKGAVMTGTGSAVFGIFKDLHSAEAICSKMKKEYGFCCASVPVGNLL